MMKKFVSTLLIAALMLGIISTGVVAADSNITMTYDITSSGVNEVEAETNDEITVLFTIKRTDSDEGYAINAIQNEMIYDKEFFQFVEGSQTVIKGGSAGVDHQERTTGVRIVKASDMSGTGYTANQDFCTFRLKVIGTSGSGWVTCDEYMAFDTSYRNIVVTPQNLKVTIAGQTNVPVAGVTVSPTEKTLVTAGEAFDLIATVSPADATDKGVSYVSSDPSVATVDASGHVTAVSNGTTTITVTTNDGGYTASCTVTVDIPVIIPVTGIAINPINKTMNVGETFTPEVIFSPADATNKTVFYSSSNSQVASVDAGGIITANSAGNAVITATTQDGNFSATCHVTVNVPVIHVTGVTVTPAVKVLNVGDVFNLGEGVSVLPANADNKAVTYSSADPSIATVDVSGIITAHAEGTTVITVTTVDGGFTATCSLTVNSATTIPVTGITVTPTARELYVGDVFNLSTGVNVLPENAGNKAVTYSTSNSSVAVVSAGGVITAASAGTAVITVTTADGGFTATCTVTVKRRTGGGGGGGGATPVVPTNLTLTFNTNGGSLLNVVQAPVNTEIDLGNYKSTREGYVFVGWFADEGLTESVTKVIMKNNMMVYAKWQEVPTDTKPEILTDEHEAYILGREDGLIHPEANITRAEVATIFFRLLKDDIRNENMTRENKFDDVKREDWHNTAVSTLASMGILKGRTESSFAPDEFITRAEYATIAARFSDYEYSGADMFTDIDEHWAESYINSAASLGWVIGENGVFRPDDFITRAEAMTLTNRVLNRLPENADDLLDGMKRFPDNNENEWYYLYVQEATNSHSYEMKGDGIHEKWTSLRPNRDWTKIEQQ